MRLQACTISEDVNPNPEDCIHPQRQAKKKWGVRADKTRCKTNTGGGASFP